MMSTKIKMGVGDSQGSLRKGRDSLSLLPGSEVPWTKIYIWRMAPLNDAGVLRVTIACGRVFQSRTVRMKKDCLRNCYSNPEFQTINFNMGDLKLPNNPKRRFKRGDACTEPPVWRHRGWRCSYGLLPGQCLNAQCPSSMHGQVIYQRPGLEKEVALQRKQLEEAVERKKKAEREIFFEEERRLMGMKNSSGGETMPLSVKPSQEFQDYLNRKVPSKTMRMPARPLCMLDAHKYTPPTGDYAELSRFLRLSTMPGHSSNEHVSEYNGTHNQEVWDGQKDLNRQAFKMKRDWLSIWGEFNVKEQRWRKAWVEKFGAEKV